VERILPEYRRQLFFSAAYIEHLFAANMVPGNKPPKTAVIGKKQKLAGNKKLYRMDMDQCTEK
jgi:hypothetical protein